MTEDVNVKALKENPELFRILLKNAVEEIASGMWNEDTPDVFQQQEELLQGSLKASIFPLIDDMWNRLGMNQKFLCLNQIEEKYPVDYVAWRPVDDIPMQTLKGNYLTQMKERLLYETEKYKNEENELKKQLIAKGAALRKSLRKIKTAEEVLADLNNYYEKTIQMNHN